MINNILKYPRGAKKRDREDHAQIIAQFATRFGVDSDIKLLWFYTMVYSLNGRTLKPKATIVKGEGNQRNVWNVRNGGEYGNYLSQDGYNFRPMGFFRLVGRNTYNLIDAECRRVLGYRLEVENYPSTMLLTFPSLVSAMAFWSVKCRNCSSLREVVYTIEGDIFKLGKRIEINQSLVSLTK